MKPHPAQYNPAPDGISAKIWECLRNNPEFSQLLKRARASDEESRNFARTKCSLLWNGPLAQLAFVLFAMQRNVDCLEDRTWPELHEDLHEAIDSAASNLPLPPVRVGPPNLNLFGSSPSESDLRKSTNSLVNMAYLWDQYTVLAIPNFIRDTRHRKLIMAKLGKMVPPAKVTETKLRDDKRNGGKLLGTKKDWEVWFFVKYFESRVPRPSAARTLAAVWLYEPEAFDGAESESYFLTGPGRKDAEDLYVQREEKVDSHLSPIESGIHNVYPVFSVFQ